MSISYAHEFHMTCSACQFEFVVKSWLIIDMGTRPDLLELEKTDILRNYSCPNCQEESWLDLPLMIYRPIDVPPIVYCYAESTDQEENSARKRFLISMLKENLGSAWQPEWEEKVLILKREVLRAALISNSHFSIHNLAEIEAQSLQHLRSANPVEFLKKTTEYWIFMEPLPQAQLLGVTPELLSPTVLEVLDNVIDFATNQKNYRLLEKMQTNRNFLQYAIAVGVEKAYREIFEVGISSEIVSLVNEANEIGKEIEKNNETQLIEKAASLWSAILVHPGFQKSSPRFQIAAWNDSASIYTRRYWRTGSTSDLDRAAELLKMCLENILPDDPIFPGLLSNFSAIMSERYYLLGDREDLDKMMSLARQALESAEPDSIHLPNILNNLGGALHDIDKVTGSIEDLEESLRMQHRALEILSPDSPEFTNYSLNYLARLRSIYERTSNKNYLIEAAEVAMDTALVMSEDSPYYPSFIGKVSAMFDDLYVDFGDTTYLNQAIQWQRAVLKTLSPSSRDYSGGLNNLGLSLLHRYEALEEINDLRESIGYCQEAVERISQNSFWMATYLNNLANSAQALYKATNEEEYRDLAISSYREACNKGLEKMPEECLRAGANWLRWASHRHNWDEVIDAYSYIEQCLDQLIKIQISTQHEIFWLTEVQESASIAALAYSQKNDLEKCCMVLESSRGYIFRDSFERGRKELYNLSSLGYSDLLSQYVEAASNYKQLIAIGKSEDQPENWRQQTKEARNRLDEIIKVIREEVGRIYPKYKYFLSTPPLDEIKSLTTDFLLLYLFYTPQGGMALSVSGNKISNISLAELTEAAIEERIQKLGHNDESFLSTYRKWKDNIHDEEAILKWQNVLQETTNWLWRAVMAPVIETLNRDNTNIKRVVLVPTGLLSLLPLHAAWQEDLDEVSHRCYALDSYQFTYAPDAKSLLYVRDQAQKLPADSLLVIVDPQNDLNYSGTATETALRLFDNKRCLSSEMATLSNVKELFSKYNVLYFFTHGMVNFEHPVNSGLVLSNGQLLTINDIANLRTDQAKMAILSACESGIPADLSILNEVVSLPNEMIHSGIPSVIGSLWAVSQISTAILMGLFFELWREQQIEPPLALQLAQRILRDAWHEGDHRKHVLQYIPAQLSELMNEDEITELLKKLSHPFYWAAFTYAGY